MVGGDLRKENTIYEGDGYSKGLIRCKLVETGIRPGEKLHEQMIGPEDASFTYEYPSYYKIIPSTLTEEEKRLMSENGMIVPENFSYTSQHNKEWMTYLS